MRQTSRSDKPPGGSSGDAADSSGNLNNILDQAERFLEAGDAAIARALAGADSEAFLRANRQQGGQ